MVKAWVVLRQGHAATEAEIRAYCRERLVAYKVPKQVEFRDSLSKSAVGKILRRELAREAREARSLPSPIRSQGVEERVSLSRALSPALGLSGS